MKQNDVQISSKPRRQDIQYTLPMTIPNYPKNIRDQVRAGNQYFYFRFSKHYIRNGHRFGIWPMPEVLPH
jgi:hypothetical protein